MKTVQKDQRLVSAASLLTGTNLRISQVAYRVGFNDLSNFSRAFKKRTGRTPKQYREKFHRVAAGRFSTRGNGDVRSDVILVDEKGRQVGVCEKLEAHRRGFLHKAFSIFVFNRRGEILIHKRTDRKYHSRGLWSNTCCSHPRPGGVLLRDAQLRLLDEMGFTCDLREVFQFTYQADLEDDLREHEWDHVLVGRFHGPPNPNQREVEDWAWVSAADLEREIKRHPQDFTAWLKICFKDTVETCGRRGLLPSDA